MSSLQKAAFAAYTFLLLRPFDIPDPLGVGPDLSWTCICLTAALITLVPEWLKAGWPATQADVPLSIYVAIVLLTTATAVNVSHTLVWLVALAGQIGVFAATVTLARRDPAFARAWLTALVGMVFVALLLATAYHAEVGLLTRPKLYPSPEGWTGYPQLGTLAVVQFAVLVAAMLTIRRRLALIPVAVLVALTVIELALLYSRGSWVAAGAVLLVIPTVVGTVENRRRLAAAAALIAVLAGVFTVRNPMLRRLALGDTTADLKGYTLQLATPEMRLELWKRTARMIADHPITGVGLGNFQQVFESAYNPEVNNDGRRGVHAHNLWLQAYAELGVAGGTAFAVLSVVVLFAAWRAARRSRQFGDVATFLALVALTASNLTTNLFFLPGLVSGRLASLQWILAGLALAHPSSDRHLIVRRSSPSGVDGQPEGVCRMPSAPADSTNTRGEPLASRTPAMKALPHGSGGGPSCGRRLDSGMSGVAAQRESRADGIDPRPA